MKPTIKAVAMNVQRRTDESISDWYFEWYCPHCDQIHWHVERETIQTVEAMSQIPLTLAVRCSITDLYMRSAKDRSPLSACDIDMDTTRRIYDLPPTFGEATDRLVKA